MEGEKEPLPLNDENESNKEENNADEKSSKSEKDSSPDKFEVRNRILTGEYEVRQITDSKLKNYKIVGVDDSLGVSLHGFPR